MHVHGLYKGAKIGFFSEYIYLCKDICVLKIIEVKRSVLKLLIALLAISLMSLTGCRRYEQIRVEKGKIVSVSMDGLKAVDLTMLVEVDNPAGKVVIKKAEGNVSQFGKVIGKVSLAPLKLLPRTTSEYVVKARVELSKGLGFKDLMSLTSPKGWNECLMDIEISGNVAGVAVKRKFKEVPLKKLLENRLYEKN